MDKVCGVLVFLIIYQFAGMFGYHDAPILDRHELIDGCNTLVRLFGFRPFCS